jgi:hypothetical protein
LIAKNNEDKNNDVTRTPTHITMTAGWLG